MRRGAFGCAFEIAQTLILTILIFFGVQAFVAQPFQVRQGSMEHTLEPNQYVLVDKLTPRLGGYHRGDIVVFNPPDTFPDEDGTPFIKRIVGMPGEVVDVRPDGFVYVDGTKLPESYLFEDDGTPPTSDREEWTVPAGDVFVMGDHREASADSRVFGPVAESTIIGRAWLRYWPLPLFGILGTPTYPAVAAP
jgi:signal peptidase I